MGELAAVDAKARREVVADVIGLRACHWGDAQRSVNITFAGGKVLLASAKNLK